MTSKSSHARPLVTVVTVTYNSSMYVRDAIESVLAQSYDHLEFIIADDCSTDNTWSIIQEYNDPRINSYRNEKNLLEYPNRNKALEKASGKYLIFIDGDDVMYPHGLEFMVRMAESFPDSAMAVMRAYRPNIIYPVEVSPHDLFVAEYFHKSLLDIAFTNTLFTTSVLKEMGGLPTGYISGDTYIRLKIARQYPCLLINDNLTWWRVTPGQASSKLVDSLEGVVQNYEYKSSLLENAPLTDEQRLLALKNLRYKVVHRAARLFLKGQFRKSLYLLKATRLVYQVPAYLIYSYTSIDPFSEYSSARPLKRRFSDHPYSILKSD